MAFLITNAILHIVNNHGDSSRFSDVELDVDSETCFEFVGKHARRLLNNPGAREAVFTEESEAYHLVKAYQKGEIYFKDMSRRLCERLADIMRENRDIPPADILVAAFDNGGNRYLAIVKLNYGECFTHRVTVCESGVENHIVKSMEVLPAAGGKVEDACLIPWDPMVLRVIEKPRAINGVETNYFSKLFIQCETEPLSKKETAGLIEEISGEIGAKYFDDNVEVAAKLKCALMTEAQSGEEDTLNLENAVSRVFHENEAAAAEFIAMAKEAGLSREVKLDKSFVQRAFKTQTFKADNGVELKFPAELYEDPESIRFETNADGTVTITLKNLRKHASA